MSKIIKKYRGKYQYVGTVGSSSDAQEIEELCFQGKKWIMEQKCERDMFLEQALQADEKAVVEVFWTRLNIFCSMTRN